MSRFGLWRSAMNRRKQLVNLRGRGCLLLSERAQHHG